MNRLKLKVSVALNNGHNVPIFTCICGQRLREIKSTTREYTQHYGTIFCDICNQKCKRRQPFYHCNRGKNAPQHRRI